MSQVILKHLVMMNKFPFKGSAETLPDKEIKHKTNVRCNARRKAERLMRQWQDGRNIRKQKHVNMLFN